MFLFLKIPIEQKSIIVYNNSIFKKEKVTLWVGKQNTIKNLYPQRLQ